MLRVRMQRAHVARLSASMSVSLTLLALAAG